MKKCMILNLRKLYYILKKPYSLMHNYACKCIWFTMPNLFTE